MGILEFLEQTALATFIRESSSYLGFPTFLFMHTLGLSLVVGANAIVALRVMGFAPGIPLKPLVRLFPFMWVGFILTVISGAGLAIATATSKLTNPILLAKLVLIVFAGAFMWSLEKKIFRDPGASKNPGLQEGKALSAALLILWLVVTLMGRLIAYSSTIFGT